MTVGELLMQLVNYPDDMVVVVEHTNVCVSCDTKDKDGFTDFEIVTPGVDFRTGEDLFDKYEYTDFKIIHHNTNVGTVKNLNNACKQCDGDYILLLSCGDVFFEVDTVDKVVKRFQESKCDAMAVRRLAYENNYSPIFFLPHMHSINKIEKKIIY